MFNKDATYQKVIAGLQAQISDLTALLDSQQKNFAAERKDLLDRLLAVATPSAHRLVHPSVAPSTAPQGTGQRPMRFPGYRPDTDAPRPLFPPTISSVTPPQVAIEEEVEVGG